MKGARGKWIAGMAVVLLIVLAWFDGGERPLRQIEEPVPVPGSAR